MTLSSSAVPWLDAHSFENRGSAVWQLGTNFILQNGARIVNAPGATLQVASVTSEYVLASNSGALPVIENRGVFTVTGSAPLRTTAIFSNTGVLDVAPGATFKIDRVSSASDGLLRVQGGATLDLQEPVPVRGSVQIDGVLRATQGAVTWQPAAAQFGPGALVHVNGGTLTAAGPLTTPALYLQTGTINGTATITATQHFTWTEGTMSGAGRTVTLGRMRLSGNQNWWLDARTLENRGDALWSLSSGFIVNNGARIVNAPGATWTLQSQGSERNVGDNSGAPGLIDNRGLLQVSGGLNLRLNSRLENSGVIDVQAATLRVTLGGVNSGALRVQEGATADFGASYTLGGTLNLSGTLQTSTSAPTLTYQPAAATFGPQGVIRHVGGVFTVGSDQTVTRFAMTAGTLNGSAAITATQHLTWTGGTMEGSGRTASTGRMSLSSSNLFVNQRTLENRGTARFALADGSLFLNSGARLVNAPGATLTVDAPSGLLREIGWQNNEQPTFDNQGLLVKAGAGTVRLRPHFDHGGVVEVQAGTLELYDTGTTTGSATGSFVVSNGALLHFSGGYTLDPGSNVSGPGNVRFAAAVTANGGYAISGVTTVSASTVTFGPATQPQLGSQLRIESSGNAVLNSADPLLLPQLVLVSGELRGSASISVTEAMTWTGGTIRAGGPIAVHSRLDLPSTTTVHLDGRTLESRGTARLPLGGTFQMSNGARLVNAVGASMTVDLSADRSVIFNQGTVTPSL
jgi:hypothetical protein